MVGPCNVFGRKRNVHTGLFWGNVKGRNHLEDLGVDGYVILTLWRLTTYIYVVPHS